MLVLLHCFTFVFQVLIVVGLLCLLYITFSPILLKTHSVSYFSSWLIWPLSSFHLAVISVMSVFPRTPCSSWGGLLFLFNFISQMISFSVSLLSLFGQLSPHISWFSIYFYFELLIVVVVVFLISNCWLNYIWLMLESCVVVCFSSTLQLVFVEYCY